MQEGNGPLGRLPTVGQEQRHVVCLCYVFFFDWLRHQRSFFYFWICYPGATYCLVNAGELLKCAPRSVSDYVSKANACIAKCDLGQLMDSSFSESVAADSSPVRVLTSRPLES